MKTLLVFIGFFFISSCVTFVTKPYEESFDEAKLSELLYRAKTFFKEGLATKAWDFVNEAEELSPNDYRVKAMKGSLLYKSGDYEEAKKYWQESLDRNPEQPKIKKLLKSP